MRKIKRAAALIASLYLAAFCAGCGNNGGNENITTGTPAPSSAPSASASVTSAASATEVSYPSGTVEAVFNGKYKKTLDFGDYIKLSGYKGLDVTYNGRTRAEVLAGVSALGKTDYEKITDGAVSVGDVLDMDFKAYKKGADDPFMSSASYRWNTGKGEFFDILSLDLTGEKIGDEIKRSLTFPGDYSDKDLRGVEAEFVIKINYVLKYSEKSADDAFIEKYTGGKYKTVSDYADALYEKEVVDGVKDACFEMVYEDVVQRGAAYDEEIIKALSDDMRRSDEDLADQLKTTPHAYYGLTEEAYEARLDSLAKAYFTKELLIYAVAHIESIPFTTDEEANEYINEKAASLWMTPEKYAEMYGMENVKETVFWDKVKTYLAKSAVIRGKETKGGA